MAATERAFLMVWDGLRPDQVAPDVTPNLWQLAQRGVWFERSYAVFPSVTRANSPAISTGCRPGRHGVPGNTFLMANAHNQLERFTTGDAANLQRLANADGRPILLEDTLADRVHRRGGSTVVVGSGSPGSGFLQHPRAAETGDPMIVDGLAAMAPFMEAVRTRFGPLPSRHAVPASRWTAYFTRIITDFVVPELAPTLLVFWHTDPDHTNHHRGYSAPETTRALRDADAHLGLVMEAYEPHGLRSSTAVVVTSDHGGSTITGRAQPVKDLAPLGVADNGGAVFVYSSDSRAVAAIRELEYVGPVFTRDGRDNTFPLSAVGLDGPRAPEVVFSFAWSAEAVNGVPGGVIGSPSKLIVDHGSLSPFDLRNTLVVEGPDFRSGWRDPLPVGNIDVCPTLAHVLGLEVGQPDGRVLSESLRDWTGDVPGRTSTTELVSEFSARGVAFRQRIWFEGTPDVKYLAGGDVQPA